MRIFLIILASFLLSCQSNDQSSKSTSNQIENNKEQVKAKEPKSTTEKKVRGNSNIRSAVMANEKWYFITQDGNRVDNKEYAWVDNYSCGRACVSTNYKIVNGMGNGHNFFFIDKNGNPGKKKFYQETRYYDDRTFLIDQGNKWGLFDLDENIVATGFDEVGRFSEGLSYVSKDGKIGYINKDGDWEFEVEKGLQLSPFQDGLALAKKDGKTGYLNKTGEWQVQPIYDAGSVFKDNRAVVKKDGVLSLIDKSGNIVSDLDGDFIAGFSEGLSGIRKDGKWGYIDVDANLVIDMSYKNCRPFSEGYAAIMTEDKVGFVDKSGDIVIDTQFFLAYDFVNTLAMAAKDGKVGYIDKSGAFVIEPTFERARNFVDINETNDIVNN